MKSTTALGAHAPDSAAAGLASRSPGSGRG
ncbi:hypothetical protein GA0115259_101081, partial [Streptomyces sp. MnatMP-M17]